MKTEFFNDIEAINAQHYEVIVIGVSAGGFNALGNLFTALKPTFRLPIIVVQHRMVNSENDLEDYFRTNFKHNFSLISDKQMIHSNSIYIAPANYHLLIETNKTLALSVDKSLLFSRPSIDVLFTSAAEVFKHKIIGIILTGANSDGAEGLRTIKQQGGLTIVENPETAHSGAMPAAAIKASDIDYIIDLKDIISFINQLK